MLRTVAVIGGSLLYANTLEWIAHKYLLHGLGKDRGSRFSYHWHYHHHEVRQHGYYDAGYERSLFDPAAHRPEALGMVGLAVVHLPLYWRSRTAFFTLAGSALAYVLLHKQSHQDPEWARRWLPWHYDHHMGPSQDANWCVTFPLMDQVLGTRIPYVGTDREWQSRERNDERAHKAMDPEAVKERSKSYPSFFALLREDVRWAFEKVLG